MITFTLPHCAGESCRQVFTRLAGHLRRFKSGSGGAGIRKRFMVAGAIRGMEVTFGGNGWHVHAHEIWWSHARGVQEVEIFAATSVRWADIASGGKNREDVLRNGVDVRGPVHSGDYLQKWGAESEILGGAAKGDWQKNPFSLAERSPKLFMDYSRGMRGCIPLFFSGGLRDIKEIEPESPTELDCLLAQVSPSEWGAVCRAGLRADILSAAEKQGALGIAMVISRANRREIGMDISCGGRKPWPRPRVEGTLGASGTTDKTPGAHHQ